MQSVELIIDYQFFLTSKKKRYLRFYIIDRFLRATIYQTVKLWTSTLLSTCTILKAVLLIRSTLLTKF